MTINGAHLDDVVAAYTAWRRHSQTVREAYDAWSAAPSAEKSCRYAAYLSELDREQRACELYAEQVARGVAA
jgi:hypothetical protein